MLSEILSHWHDIDPFESELRRSLITRTLSVRLPVPGAPAAPLRFRGRAASWVKARSRKGGGVHEPGTVRALIALGRVLGPGATVYDVGILHGYVSLLAPSAAETAPRDFRRTVIDLIALDDHARRTATRPDVIKIDVEGAQASVLAGATGLLDAAAPVLLIETDGPGAVNAEGTPMAVLAKGLIERHGYAVARVDHRSWAGRPEILAPGSLAKGRPDLDRNALLICARAP